MKTPPLRALIVDDERPARKQMGTLLAAYPDVIDVVGEAASVEAACVVLAQKAVDVIFLDVQMPEADGFELLPRLPQPPPRVVFVTAHNHFAVRAFEAAALDYLLKPVNPTRLKQTVARLVGQGAASLTEPPAHGDAAGRVLEEGDFVTLRDGGHLQIVKVEQIAWIEAEGSYSRVQLAGKGSIWMLRSIGEWERLLPVSIFARLDRSLLVNLRQIREVDTRGRNEAWLGFRAVEAGLQIGRTASVKLRGLLRREGAGGKGA